MVKFRPNTIKQIDANKVATDFTEWCKNKSNCLYKDKKRKFHGWLNLDHLSQKNKVAQCGWDDGNCNHTTKYGIGGYHNVCPIGGFNGDLPWPAKLKLSNFKFKGISSSAKIKSVTVYFEHRMVAISTKTGTKYDNFGPNFHNSKGGWACKIYFTNGTDTISKVVKHTKNPKLSKKKFDAVTYKFTDVTVEELLKSDFALNIAYNHNYNTNPGIIYLKNVYLNVSYEDADSYIKGSSDKDILYLSTDTVCASSTATHTIEAGYKNQNGVISPSNAPKKLGKKIYCSKKPSGVTVSRTSSNDSKSVFSITDNSGEEGKKTIKYAIEGEKSKKLSLSYTAKIREKPKYEVVTEYKSGEDFDSSKEYISFKNGCASKIYIYVDSINSTPLELSVPIENQNSSINLLSQTSIHSFHTKMKNLSCGYHTLYIKRGNESLTDVLKNKVQIKISPLQLAFEIYHSEGANKPLEYIQNKKSGERYEYVCIKRVDDEPKKEVDIVIKNGSVTTEQKVTKVIKGQVTNHTIDKYKAGNFFIFVSEYKSGSQCQYPVTKKEFIVNSYHKQNYDFLFTRGEAGTAFDFDYLVAWEGDNINKSLTLSNISLHNSANHLRICSKSVQVGLSQIGLAEVRIKNTSSESMKGIQLELNVLEEDEDGEKTVTTSEWTNDDGIFNQFYTLFEEYNLAAKNNVKVRNLTPDNDLVDEENVYLSIDQINPQDTITVYLPFRSVSEKTIYLQILLFEEPLKIYEIETCDDDSNPQTDIKISVCDSMLTKLDISGNTDLLLLDPSYQCPEECYTTKTTNDRYETIGDTETGGITYKITNIDTNDFRKELVATKIINDNELLPYGYILHGNYYPLINNNNEAIKVQEREPMLNFKGEQIYDEDGNPMYETNKVEWARKMRTKTAPLPYQNLECQCSFPGMDKVSYTVKTDKNGVAIFFIPIPNSINRTYTIKQLFSEKVLSFIFKQRMEEVLDNNGNVVKRAAPIYGILHDEESHSPNIKYEDDFKIYEPGETISLPVYLTIKNNQMENVLTFNASLGDVGSSDEVTVLYKICNLDNNEGSFKTIFETDDQKLLPTKISKNIYCGLDTDIKISKKIEKRILESTNLNAIYLNVTNGKKENKDVEIEINLGKISPQYLGNYDFIDINMENGDYAITEEDGNIYVNWLIGQMKSFQEENCIIKIKAKDVGLSKIQFEVFDYLHKKGQQPIEVKKSNCQKCDESSTWRLVETKWKKVNGKWVKK